MRLRGNAARRKKANEPSSRRRTVVFGGITLALVVAISGLGAWLLVGGSGSEDPSPPSAVIVDQLSQTFPNQGFVDQATSTLEAAGYAVDYVSGDETDVDFYRKLPTLGYDVVIFRNHADRLQAREANGDTFDEVVIFTSEPYDRERFRDDQAANRLVISRYSDNGPGYFGIAARYVEETMIGDFDGATIIMMGCEGLLTDRTAKAFIERGASSYISWDETVSASHTDAVGERLLQLLLNEGLSPNEAAARAMEELGPDPAFGSTLRAYPPSS